MEATFVNVIFTLKYWQKVSDKATFFYQLYIDTTDYACFFNSILQRATEFAPPFQFSISPSIYSFKDISSMLQPPTPFF